MKGRKFWLRLSLINLAIVAFLGFGLRSKILFTLPFINYRDLLSAHSHFAFGGWVGLALLTLFVFDILPTECSGKKIYQWILGAVQLSSLGMAFSFPFMGYNAISIFFSTLFIAAIVVFIPVFIKDLLKGDQPRAVRILSIGAQLSMLLSLLGTLGLVYILASNSGNSLLYRDSIYTFLHFQYNGFFTLSVFALMAKWMTKHQVSTKGSFESFAFYLVMSVVPSLFLSLLWHNNNLLYLIAIIGCILIFISMIHFYRFIINFTPALLFTTGTARVLWYFAMVSFSLKMILNIGTIFPQLGNAVYGDRPIIIGFLHLVFLGFISFYILATLAENGYFSSKGRMRITPLAIFAAGIFANEILLMVQGLSILLNTNSQLYSWLLWIAAIILFIGASAIATSVKEEKRAMRS